MSARAGLVGVLLAVGGLSGSATAATDVDVDPTAPTVSFLDDRPITRAWEDITKAGEAGGLAVTVRNDAATPQKIRFDLLGLPPELPSEHVPDEFTAREVRRVVLPLRSGAAQPKEEKYEGVLVASGESGGVVRLPVTITVPATPAARGEALSPDDISDQTISTTNFVPSLANPYGPSIVVLALAGLALLWLFRRRLKLLGRGLNLTGNLLAISGALLLAAAVLWAGICGHVFDHRDDQDGWEVISTKSLPVTKAVADGTYGTATNDEGDIAAIVVKKQRLRADGLDRAGAYKGKADFTAGEDGGDATVTFNVRDWWPFAFVVIALGVLIGYAVRREFTTHLPRERLLLELKEVADAHSSTVHKLLPSYDISATTNAMYADVARTAQRDPTQAQKELDAFETYLKAYSALGDSLRALLERYLRLEKIVNRLEPPVQIEHVNQLDQARRLLFPRSLESHTEEEFKTLDADVEEAKDALDELEKRSEDIVVLRDWATENKKLALIEADLDKLERELFTAPPDDFDKRLRALVKKVEGPARREFDAVEHRRGGGDAPPPGSSRSERTDAAIKDRERRATWVAGALAVTSGLSVLYFADGVWGTPGDYLAALVWGAAASEGLKYAKSLADKTWGD